MPACMLKSTWNAIWKYVSTLNLRPRICTVSVFVQLERLITAQAAFNVLWFTLLVADFSHRLEARFGCRFLSPPSTYLIPINLYIDFSIQFLSYYLRRCC